MVTRWVVFGVLNLVAIFLFPEWGKGEYPDWRGRLALLAVGTFLGAWALERILLALLSLFRRNAEDP